MKQKILYVDKKPNRSLDHPSISLLSSDQETILRTLESSFDTDFLYNFSDQIRKQIAAQAINNTPYAGLVTHFPYNKEFFIEVRQNPYWEDITTNNEKKEEYYQRLYEESFKNLSQIRQENQDLIIIIYTGAFQVDEDPCKPILEKIIKTAGANRTICRSENIESDAKQIPKSLEMLIRTESI